MINKQISDLKENYNLISDLEVVTSDHETRLTAAEENIQGKYYH